MGIWRRAGVVREGKEAREGIARDQASGGLQVDYETRAASYRGERRGNIRGAGILSGGSGVTGALQGAGRGAAANLAQQGIALATGLQSKFDWTGAPMTENDRARAARDTDDRAIIDDAVEQAEPGAVAGSAGGALQRDVSSQADLTRAIDDPEADVRPGKADDIANDQAYDSDRGPDRQ